MFSVLCCYLIHRILAAIREVITMASIESQDTSPLIKLNDGRTIPQLGLGTFLSDKGLVGEAVKQAIKMGECS